MPTKTTIEKSSTTKKTTPKSTKKATTTKKTTPIAATKKTTTKKTTPTTTNSKKTVVSKKTTSTKTVSKRSISNSSTVKKPATKKTTKPSASKASANKKKIVQKAIEIETTTLNINPNDKPSTVTFVKPVEIENIETTEDAKKIEKTENPVKIEEESPIRLETHVTENSDFNQKKVLKKKIKLSKFSIALIFLILILLLTFICKKIIFNTKDYKLKANYSTSFFIKNNKGKYALFNDSGKKITGFDYDVAGEFVDGSSVVQTEKQGYAIINEKGKVVVPFGKYGYISSYNGLYRVRSDDGYSIIDGNGKIIISGENIDLNSYGDDYPFVVVRTNTEIIVYSYDGKNIVSFKRSKNAKEPTVNHLGDYATIYYNGKNVLFNAKKKKVVTKFKEDIHYCINNYTKDEKMFTLNTCSSWFEVLNKEGSMIIYNKKANDLTDKCKNFVVYDNTIICVNADGYRFIEKSGDKVKAGKKLSNRYAFADNENYCLRDNESYKLEFYKDNKKVKTIDASLYSTGKINADLYVLFIDNAYEFYSLSGKKALSKSYKKATQFDENLLSRVSDDGENYYLINKKGKKVSKEYSSISSINQYYIVQNSENKKGLIDSKGKEIIPIKKYTNITVREFRDKFYAIASVDFDLFEVYDLNKNKIVLSSKKPITINEHYIKTSGDKNIYYTLKGKQFYKD